MRMLSAAPLAVIVSLTMATGASAVQFFSGQDDGVGPNGSFTNSRAAEQQFLAAAAVHGGVVTEGFESAELGVYLPLSAQGMDIYYAGYDHDGATGVRNTQIDGLYGFNVTEGGSNWFGFPDLFASQAFFIFENPTNSFGFYTTGVQSAYTSSLSLTLIDGSMLTFELPVNGNGGASYFGMVDSVGFTQIAISQTNAPGYADAWGIDNVSYNFGDAAAAVPEPASWLLMIAGFGMVGFAARRGSRPVAA